MPQMAPLYWLYWFSFFLLSLTLFLYYIILSNLLMKYLHYPTMMKIYFKPWKL